MNNQLRNVLVCTDTYKASHFKQIPPDAEASRFYLAPRRKLLGAEYDDFIMFGLSYFIKKYLERPITEVDIQYAHKIWDHFNVGGGAYPFPYEAFQRIVDDFDGRLPIPIAGIPEGMAFSEYNTPIAMAWLYRILKNSFINEFRKKGKEPSKVDYQEVENFYNSDDVDDTRTVDLRVDTVKDMIGDEVTNALNSLAIDFRTVIILCDLEGFTYEEMAKILDIPIGTVRSRLHRARNLLKEKLNTYASSMGFGNN